MKKPVKLGTSIILTAIAIAVILNSSFTAEIILNSNLGPFMLIPSVLYNGGGGGGFQPSSNGYAGIQATIILDSLNITPMGGNCLPQTNLFLETGDHYYCIQVLLSYSNSLGVVSNTPPNGFILGFCAFDFGNVSSFPPTYFYELPGFPYPNFTSVNYNYFAETTIPAQLTLFTFIGKDLNLYTVFCVNDQLVADVDWQSTLGFPNLTAGAQFVSEKFFSAIRCVYGNQIIFTEPDDGIMSAEGKMLVLIFDNGQFQNPPLGLVDNHYSNIPGYPYYDYSAEQSLHLNWQISGNTVSFSPVTISDYTGVVILDSS
jgi:hypothetical protein